MNGLTSRATRLARLRLTVLTTVAAVLVASLLSPLLGPIGFTNAALQPGGGSGEVLIGRDDDNVNNPIIQPPNTAANQSLNNADALGGFGGKDVVIGLLGSDVISGGPGRDILIGGPEQGTTPNSDMISGDEGDDVNVWAPGDGSDLFVGGPGVDAMVFGVIDRNAQNVPTLGGSYPGFNHGIPTANVTGQGGFCTLEKVTDPNLGYQFLVRFFVRATGALAVTVRQIDVEQVFCTSQAGGQVIYADLRDANPQFRVVTLDEVQHLNPLVRAIIR